MPRALLARLWQGGARAPGEPLTLTAYGKPGCTLCDKAKEPVARAVRAYAPQVTVEWVNILSDPALVARWGEWIPVVCAGETVLAEGKISALRLRRALTAYLDGDGDGGSESDGR